MKARSLKYDRFVFLLCLVVGAVELRAVAQTPAEFDLQLYAGIAITWAVGIVYSVE